MTREEAISILIDMATELQISFDSKQGIALKIALNDIKFADTLANAWREGEEE